MEIGKIEFGPNDSQLRTTNAGEWMIAKSFTPVAYDFTPQEDMTPLESSWCGHFFAWRLAPGLSNPPQYPQWELIKRHFTEVK